LRNSRSSRAARPLAWGHASVTTTIDRHGQLMPNADGRLAAALAGAFSCEVVALRPAA